MTAPNDYLSAICDAVFVERFGDVSDNASLSDIAEITMGQSPSGKSYNEKGEGAVFYQGRAEFGWRFPAQRLFTTEPKRMARKGDVLMSVRAPVGDLNVAYEDCCIGRGLASIHSRYPSFCFYLMRSLKYKLDAYNGEGTVFGSINGRALNSLSIGLPNADDIIAFEDFAAPIDQRILTNVTEERNLANLRDVLLPKLMSGEIDVSKVELPTQPNNHLVQLPSSSSKMISPFPMRGAPVESVINNILNQMESALSSRQLKRLAAVLREELEPSMEDDQELLGLFLTAKEVEGCSSRTLAYYESTISSMSITIAKPYTQIESNDLRQYLNKYELERAVSKVTIDNIRRILSSFFSWLEDEDYIVKSPVRRIRRVKTAKVSKEILSDEDLEMLRDSCLNARDLALVDMLATTGMRVGELVGLNIDDVNLQERECIVTGKGNKQRPVYFDARAKLHLQTYLQTRTDDSPALFVSLDATATRLSIGGVETRLRQLGKSCGIHRVHPHKFRRTLATHAIDKGMPIEQVQKLLGHARIDTTMHYAMVNQNNVKVSHRKYLE